MMKWQHFFFPVLFLLATYVCWESRPIFAQENQNSSSTTDETSVRNAGKSLGKSTIGMRQYPWYSTETDSADFVPFPKEWDTKPKTRKDRSNTEWGALGTLFASLGYWTVFGIAILVVAFLLVLAWYIFYRNRDLFRKLWRKEEFKERKRRIETLPEEARDMFDDLIGAAQRAFEAGQYRLALIYYFSHQLVWLDMHQLIRMHKGKTNHEYARELRSAKEVLTHYEKSISLFEAVYYGDHPITRLQFLGLWETRHDFSRAVKAEKQRRDENKLNRAYGSTFAANRNRLTLTVDMPDANEPDIEVQVETAEPQHSDSDRSFQPPPVGLMLLLTCLVAMLFSATGCWRVPVQTLYVPPEEFDKSINGSSVFHEMTTKRGHALRSGVRANAYARNGDVVVWFARRTGCPQNETVKQIEKWLEAKPGRTFVYVGRAYESTYDYWKAVEPLAPKDEDREKIGANKREAAANLRDFLTNPKSLQSSQEKNADEKMSDDDNANRVTEKTDDNPFEEEPQDDDASSKSRRREVNSPYEPVVVSSDHNRIGTKTKCDWFETSFLEKACKTTDISGDKNWVQNIDEAKLHLVTFEDWRFADDVEPLLVVKGAPFDMSNVSPKGDKSKAESTSKTEHTFVARKKVGQSQAIFVNNAGFILNYPLVNHEHRKLAGRLVDSFGQPKKRVFVFIGYSEIDFDKANEVSDASPHVLITLLHIWPISIVLCHVIVLCAVFCFYKWPVFGRPRKIPDVQVTDFGKHIDACAELIAEAQDDEYVLKQIVEAYNRQKQDGTS